MLLLVMLNIFEKVPQINLFNIIYDYVNNLANKVFEDLIAKLVFSAE